MNFKYNGGFSIEDLSFKIESNSIYALIGNNGVGKTTILRLLVGLLKPDSGSINILDHPVTRKKDDLWSIRQKVGFLFQNPDDQLFAPTIEEDVGFGARNLKLTEKEVHERVDWALDAVGLLDYKQSSPFDLSWGQKKRTCLAGLLVMKPKILILDEPFANLDFKSIYNHLKIIETLRQEEKMTILFTTHNLFFVEKWADKVLVMEAGRSVYEGDAVSGLEKPEVKNLLGSYEEIESLIRKRKLN